jgi:hypothetical protein
MNREQAQDGALSACPESFRGSASRAYSPVGHAPLRGSRHLVPSTLRSTATEDGRA